MGVDQETRVLLTYLTRSMDPLMLPVGLMWEQQDSDREDRTDLEGGKQRARSTVSVEA